LLDVNRNVDTLALHLNDYRFGVVLVFKEQSKSLADFSEFDRNKRELYFHVRITINL
jgi:hypothetical protein